MNSNPTLVAIATVPMPVSTGLCVSCGYLTTDVCPSCQDVVCTWCLGEEGDPHVCIPCARFRHPEYYTRGGTLLRVVYGSTEGESA